MHIAVFRKSTENENRLASSPKPKSGGMCEGPSQHIFTIFLATLVEPGLGNSNKGMEVGNTVKSRSDITQQNKTEMKTHMLSSFNSVLPSTDMLA